MLTAILILGVGLTPSLISLWCLRQSRVESQARLRQSLESVQYRAVPRPPRPADQHYVEGLGLVIGNILCKHNARSPYLRCAVNPIGPCEDCRHFEEKNLI
ncbi:MAG: DUF6464 family protein [Cyanobacteria bacterium J06638_20]